MIDQRRSTPCFLTRKPVSSLLKYTNLLILPESCMKQKHNIRSQEERKHAEVNAYTRRVKYLAIYLGI